MKVAMKTPYNSVVDIFGHGGSKYVYCKGPFGECGFECSADQARRIDLWLSGATGLIQDALPDLTNEQREMLMSGTPGDKFDEMFGDDE